MVLLLLLFIMGSTLLECLFLTRVCIPCLCLISIVATFPVSKHQGSMELQDRFVLLVSKLSGVLLHACDIYIGYRRLLPEYTLNRRSDIGHAINVPAMFSYRFKCLNSSVYSLFGLKRI